MIGRPKFVLASGSPRRLSLVNQAGIDPDALRPADIDETPKRGELPRACAVRLARAKAEAALAMIRIDDELKGSYILAADTVVAVGRRILPKAELLDEAAQCLRLLSGRAHRVHSAVCLVTPKETFRQRYVETRVRFKRLSDQDSRPIWPPANGAARPAAMRRKASPGRFWSRSSVPIPTSSACRCTRR